MICRMNFNQVHSQTTSLAYISASEEVLQKNFHHMFCYDIEMTSSFLHFTWLQVHKQVKFFMHSILHHKEKSSMQFNFAKLHQLKNGSWIPEKWYGMDGL